VNEKTKNLWIKALKSGEFEQIRGRLHDGQGYCVLGVLAALAMNEGVCTFGPRNVFDGRSSTLSYNIMKWAEIGLDDELDELDEKQPYLQPGAGQIKLKYKGKETSIAELNDSGLSFEQIAEVIEKYWRGF
jgi:hypothetical protein